MPRVANPFFMSVEQLRVPSAAGHPRPRNAGALLLASERTKTKVEEVVVSTHMCLYTCQGRGSALASEKRTFLAES